MQRPPFSLRRVLMALGTWLLGLSILFAEWGWAPLVRLLGVLARLPAIARLERAVAALPPALALVVLLVPALLVLPAKLGALWLIAGGRTLAGMAALLVAKLLGTAVVARLFLLTKPQLMRLAWFGDLYARWSAWKAHVFARVRASLPWRLARVLARRMRVRA
jgi:hypothetical protein